MDAHSINKIHRCGIDSTLMVVVNAQTTTYIEVLDLKAFLPDEIYVSHHQFSCIPEDVDLQRITHEFPREIDQ